MTDKNPIKAALFDLDGVLVSTDCFHYQAWKKIADQQNIHFDSEMNHQLRGVARMQSLEIILKGAQRQYPPPEKEALCQRKNAFYVELIGTLSPGDWLVGSTRLLKDLRSKGVKLALCSSSKNARTILEKLQGNDLFEAIVDGHDITRTKPDPEIFLLAAERLGVAPAECVVFEDAESGIKAARRAAMRCVGIGSSDRLSQADIAVESLNDLTPEQILKM